MIRIDVHAAETLRTLQTYGEDTDERLMEELRLELERLQEENFLRKSVPRGGLGTDGISWGPHSETWAKRKGHDVVGFHEGNLRALIDAGVNGDTVYYEYVVDHADYFDERWPLLPDELPDTWAVEMEQTAVTWMEDDLQRLFDAA